MNQKEQFNDILSECLDRVLKGETIASCLERYPDQARELEPLLKTAMAARVFSTVKPREEFKARARYEFQAALRDMEARKSKRKFSFSFNWRPQWRWQSGWAMAVVAALVMVLGGGGTIAAAGNSMPDSALYSIKLATEKAQLSITPSDIGKAELNNKFANRRVEEIGYMATKGDAQEVQNIVARLNVNLENITVIAGDGSIFSTAQNAAPYGNNNTNTLNEVEPMKSAASFAADSSTEVNINASAAAPPRAQADGTPTSESLASGAGVTGAAPAPSSAPAIAAMSAPAQTSQPQAGGALAPTVAPAPTDRGLVVPKAAGLHSDGQNEESNGGTLSSDKEKLKTIITENYLKRQAMLEKTLAEASEAVRPAVRLAIAQSQAEFEKAIALLESGTNN